MLTDESGRIVTVGVDSAVPALPAVKQVTWQNAAVLPGFVNLHTHLELTGLRGRIVQPDFFDRVQQVGKAKGSTTADGFLRAAREGLQETWRHGTTTVADTGASGAGARALTQFGGRGVYYHEAIAPEPGLCDTTV
ncbi:MAG: amidohydrolase family protein [Gemmatimonadota bacterium]|nr:MAG: amidohydrolase family protein [Gemmatimonadota bacterium]